MISIDVLRQLAMQFPDTTEEPHFEKISFRVTKKYLQRLMKRITGRL